jgi:hypothetical protein
VEFVKEIDELRFCLYPREIDVLHVFRGMVGAAGTGEISANKEADIQQLAAHGGEALVAYFLRESVKEKPCGFSPFHRLWLRWWWRRFG